MAELRFPVRDPSDQLAIEFGDVVKQAVAGGQLADTEAPVVRELGKRLLLDGCRTFEDALDRLEGLGAGGQRLWLDEARQAAGLSTATELDRRRAGARFESAFQRLQPPDPEPWRPLQRCPECGCYPTKDGGAWREVDCSQWWCEEHRTGHEDDMKPYEPPYRVSGTGRLIPSERERKRIEAWHRERQEEEERERGAREEHERREYEAIAKVRDQYERTATISVLGHRVHPRDVTFS